MSCIPMVGKFAVGGGPDLPRSVPAWSRAKARRLTSFANSNDPWLRAIAAEHPRVQLNELLVLLDDPVDHVRRCAVKNVKMTKPLFSIAARDQDPGIAAYSRVMLEA